MDFHFTYEQQSFRQEVQRFFQTEPRGEIVDPAYNYSPEFCHKVGAKGWLGVQWPKEYGGQGRGPVEELIIKEEAGYSAAPINRGLYYTSVSLFGEFCLANGSEQQKKEYLPRIASGKIRVARGWTEPDAGYDLATVKTRAANDGNEYVVNGHKHFITGATFCEYIFLLVRTGPDVPKEKWLSFFIVDLKTPGITLSPITILNDNTVYNVFLENVRVPKENMIGEENRGWNYIEANPRFRYEANLGFSLGEIRRLFNTILSHIKATKQYQLSSMKRQLIRQRLAETAIEIELYRLLSYRVASMRSKGLTPDYEIYMAELYGGELFRRVANTGMEILGLYGLPRVGSKGMPLRGAMEAIYRNSNLLILPGSSETHRNAIALRGLRLPY